MLRSAGTYIRELMPNAGKVFTITVAPVRKHFGKTLEQSFKAAKLENAFVEMPNGERYKKLSTVEELGSRLVKLGADRGSTLVTLGGGVVGDVGGFLASIYMRGIRLRSDSHDFPGANRFLRRRQDGREPGAREKSAGHLQAAFHGADRSRCAADAARPGVQFGLV